MTATQKQQTLHLPPLVTPRERIPIVRHLIRDSDVKLFDEKNTDDLNLLQTLELTPLELDKIIKLFIDPHSSQLVDRHLHGIKKVIKHYQQGFLIKDVVKIIKIFNILADKSEIDEAYLPCMCALLKTFQYPFIKEKASDELVYETVIVECLANLGYLFRTPNSDVRSEICSCIYNLITFKRVPPAYQDYQRCSKSFLLKTVRASDLPETLVKSLTLMEEDTQMRIKTMMILQVLSTDERNCERMLQADLASRLVLRMNYPGPNEEMLFRSIEIIWNLLENGAREKVALQLNSQMAINQIREAFLQKLLQGCSNYDRQVRNDILTISNQLAFENTKLPFIECGFAKELLLFATYPEIKSHNPLTKNLKLTTCYEDFELKKLFINFALIISKNSTSYQLLSESGIVLALLSFVKPVDTNREARDWTISQFEELQLHAMSTLCILIPLLMKDYYACHGANRLLVFLEWCSNNVTDYIGYGNSFHAKGGRGSKRAQLKYCLRVIRSIVSTNNEHAIQDLTDQGAMSILSNIIKNYSKSDEPNDQIDVEIQSDVLFILTCICENDLHRKELFGNEGVDILINLLRKKPVLIWNGLGYQRLIIGTIDCIWATLVGCILNEDYFIKKEGVFYLMDILEVSPKSMQNLILGCVLDLSDNPKTLTHILQWEGKANIRISHFLCDLWRTEENENGVERDENGIIANALKPLAAYNSEEVEESLPSSAPSKAIVEVSENMRAKIYGMFCKLGFNDLSGLTNEDQLTLCIIENYLDFKLGEVFKEIDIELKLDGVEPIPPDQEALDTILRATDDRVMAVTMNQQLMAKTFKHQEDMQEKEFYYEIRKNFGFKEKRIKEWSEYVQRVSKYSELIESKNKQITAINDSRLPERDSVAYETTHNLEIPNLAVTSFSGPYITIDSTPAEITGGRLRKIIGQ